MKYEEEYNKYSKEDFIKVLTRVYEIKIQSAKRTWYKIRMKYNGKVDKIKPQPKQVKKSVTQRYSAEQKEEPSKLKILEFEDMVKLLPKHRITRTFLFKYGFNNPQINWLKDAGYEVVEDKPV